MPLDSCRVGCTLPVFADLLEPDPERQGLIDNLRRPHLNILQQVLKVANEPYRRDNSYGIGSGYPIIPEEAWLVTDDKGMMGL
jgi:hypothetical protein